MPWESSGPCTDKMVPQAKASSCMRAGADAGMALSFPASWSLSARVPGQTHEIVSI